MVQLGVYSSDVLRNENKKADLSSLLIGYNLNLPVCLAAVQIE